MDYASSGAKFNEPTASYGGDQSKTRRWKWSANVLLIGTSQSGKSQLIRRFQSLAINQDSFKATPEIGNASTESCTRYPFMYELDIPMTSYVLVNKRNELEYVPEDEHQIFSSGFWERKDVQVTPENPSAEIVRVRLFDTPGLDDSNPAMNSINIQLVLQYLNRMADDDDLDRRHLSAVIFVIKSTSAFSHSFQKWLLYYQRCMANIFGSMAVVNTDFRVSDWKKENAKQMLNSIGIKASRLSSRDLKMKERRLAWTALFRTDPTHFFIDSKPSSRKPFEEFSSANTVFDILLYLRSQGKLAIDNLHLVKLNDMLAIDARISGMLRELQDQIWSEKRDRLVKSISFVKQNRAQHAKNKLMWQNELDELEEQLAKWRSDAEFDLGSHTVPKKTKEIQITESVYPFHVIAPEIKGMSWQFQTQPTQQNKTWTGKYKTTLFGNPQVSVRSYTTSAVYHADSINEAETRKDELIMLCRDTMRLLANDSQQEGAASDSDDPEIAQIDSFLAKSDKLIKILEAEEVPLHEGFSRSAQRRYAKSIDKIVAADLVEFVEELDPSLRSAVEVALEGMEATKSHGSA